MKGTLNGFSNFFRPNGTPQKKAATDQFRVFGVDLKELMKRPNQLNDVPNVIFETLKSLDEKKGFALSYSFK
jgi:hypothetical protein